MLSKTMRHNILLNHQAICHTKQIKQIVKFPFRLRVVSLAKPFLCLWVEKKENGLAMRDYVV